MRVSPAARERAAERRRARRAEPGRAEWQEPVHGCCENCGKRGRLVRHHVIQESVVRRLGGEPFDQRNAMLVGAPVAWGGACHCHDGHHHPGVNDTRLAYEKVPAQAVAFAVELLGVDRARVYFKRKYRT